MRVIPSLLKISLTLVLSGCASAPPAIVVPHIYLGHSAAQSIIRSDTDIIKCSDKAFDRYVCMFADDFTALSSEIIWCRQQAQGD